eukprot:CAMPEP_0198219786 /NCGR_PEP_ID=MMETSP1445-20131203/76232_1 /TAXON_ID=36898 /ORGANISM="Pyramimonas sp., Strain CCMP2087" /LENGTH=99 /DNA_ID=CAMNT_0043897325 /DNA_START=261 /DNA_END=557 /DNA_ORIENTATION=+
MRSFVGSDCTGRMGGPMSLSCAQYSESPVEVDLPRRAVGLRRLILVRRGRVLNWMGSVKAGRVHARVGMIRVGCVRVGCVPVGCALAASLASCSRTWFS